VESRVGTAFGKYNITSLLGTGGMGEVYAAYDTDKKRTVALKILADGLSNDATFRTRFQRESHAAAVLQEPHVIPIHDWARLTAGFTSTCVWCPGRRSMNWSRKARLNRRGR
jgi:serine/threonine-protein kinase